MWTGVCVLQVVFRMKELTVWQRVHLPVVLLLTLRVYGQFCSLLNRRQRLISVFYCCPLLCGRTPGRNAHLYVILSPTAVDCSYDQT